MRTLRQRLAVPVTALAVSTMLAACGSQLDPDTVAAANGSSPLPGGGVIDGGVPGDDSLSGGTGDSGSLVEGSGPAGDDTIGDSGDGGGSGAAPRAGGAPPEGENAPDGGQGKDNCAGFKNQTGVTDSEIVIANVSDISGPVPGLFESARDATKAYVEFFNATSDICGRKLKVLSLDSRTDASADQQAYVKACSEAFAAVGSMGGFDSGGARAAQECGLPDLRASSVTPARQACTTCFAALAVDSSTHQNAVADHILKNYPAAAKNAAMTYLNAGAAAPNATNQVNAMERRGMKFTYVQGFDISEFNYTPYVQQMKDRGVRYVQFIGPYQNAVRLAEAMHQQSFKPDVFALDATGYSPDYVKSGGAAVEGTRVFLNMTPFEEAGSNAELQLYLSWLSRVRPGEAPTYFGAFAWSATRLFVEQAVQLGGKLSRSTLVDNVAKVDGWTSNGMHAPQHVGPRKTGECWRWIRLQGGKWVPEGGSRYLCNGVTSGS